MRASSLFVATFLILLLVVGNVGATFSIVAVDTVNGAVGGAGASCIDGSVIINDMIESVGAVHTQALWLQGNQNNARMLLNQGLDPDSIIGWLSANDVAFRPEIRQYGVVTLAGAGASASWTGAGCTSWAGHRTGPTYAIQGNILLGPEIVDSMEAAYLNTEGPLEEKLMAALEAAKVPGADTRCLSSGKSALSAFIRVIRPGDGGSPYLWENVNSTPGVIDPIDSLRMRYDIWKLLKQADGAQSMISVSPEVIEGDGGDSAIVTITPLNSAGNPPIDSVNQVLLSNIGGGSVASPATDNGDGTFSAVLVSAPSHGVDTIMAQIDAGGSVVDVSQTAAVTYYACGDADFSGDMPDIADLVYLVAYMFSGGPAPPHLQIVDMNGDGNPIPDIADLVYMVNFMFSFGPALICH